MRIHFSKEGIQVAKKYIKRYSISLIKEMQMKPQWYIPSNLLKWFPFREEIMSVAKKWSKGTICVLLLGLYIGTATTENSGGTVDMSVKGYKLPFRRWLLESEWFNMVTMVNIATLNTWKLLRVTKLLES